VNYNIGVTHTFGSNVSVEVGYVGNRGYRLLNFADINQAPLGAAYCMNTLTLAQAKDGCVVDEKPSKGTWNITAAPLHGQGPTRPLRHNTASIFWPALVSGYHASTLRRGCLIDIGKIKQSVAAIPTYRLRPKRLEPKVCVTPML